MNTCYYTGGTVVLPDKTIDNLTVEVKNGKISGIYEGDFRIPEGELTVDLQGGYLLAGFVDIHVHGGGGSDFRRALRSCWKPDKNAPSGDTSEGPGAS